MANVDDEAAIARIQALWPSIEAQITPFNKIISIPDDSFYGWTAFEREVIRVLMG